MTQKCCLLLTYMFIKYVNPHFMYYFQSYATKLLFLNYPIKLL